MSNEELISSSLGFILETLKSSKEFVLAEAPEVVRQLIEYTITIDYIAIGVGVALLILGLSLALYWSRDTYDREGFLISGVIMLFLAIIPLAMGTTELVKVKTAPKVFVLDYVADLIRPSGK